MPNVTLLARVVEVEDGYLATIDRLATTGKGATVEEAQDDLVDKIMSWIQSCDGQETLAEELSTAGYADVDEDTELELEFVE
jgi:hypothetical protein